MIVPNGLGMWSAFFDQADRGNLDLIVPRCHRSGITWLAIRGNSPKERQNLKFICERLSRENIAVYSWRYCYPGQVDKEVSAIKDCFAAGVAGHILNPEVEWGSTIGEASKLCDGIRAAFPKEYISYAPFALPGYHPNYPYAEFHKSCDSVMPQLYWTEFSDRGAARELDRFDDHWRIWNAKYPDLVKPVLPIGVTYGRGTPYASTERSNTMGEFRQSDLEIFLTRPGYYNGPISLYSYEAAFPQTWELLERYENARQIANQGVLNRVQLR